MAEPLDLIKGADTGDLGNKHLLTTTGCLTGICISSTLTAYNGIAAVATISDPTSKKVSVASGLTGGMGSLEELIGIGEDLIFEAIKPPKRSPASRTRVGTSGSPAPLPSTSPPCRREPRRGHRADRRSRRGRAADGPRLGRGHQGLRPRSRRSPRSRRPRQAPTKPEPKPGQEGADTAVAVAIGIGLFTNTARAPSSGGLQTSTHATRPT